jgi:hypothetical protein
MTEIITTTSCKCKTPKTIGWGIQEKEYLVPEKFEQETWKNGYELILEET